MARRQEWYTTGYDDDGLFDGDAVQIAQTFTLGTTGNNLTFNVSQVKVFLDALIGAALTQVQTWEIQGVQPDGSPDGTAISTGTLDTSIVTTAGAWYTITMSSGTLEAGQQYALVGKDGFTSAGNYVFMGRDAGGGYAGGNTWTSADTGATWTDAAPIDCLFQIEGGTYDGTLCTLADAVNRAGANASAGSTEEILVSSFVIQAESFVNSATKINWTDIYATLNNDVKQILNHTVSCLAAIDIITYDMAGYSSRVEAETMINTYREEINRNLFFLLNEDNKEFILGA